MISQIKPISIELAKPIILQNRQSNHSITKITDEKILSLGRELLQQLNNLDKPLVFYDLETTGLEGNNCRIVELSLIKLYPNSDMEIWTEKINPKIEIPEIVTKLHGITNEIVKDCHSFEEIAKELNDFIGDSHLSGYNIINFDLPVLKNEFKRTGIQLTTEGKGIIDPVRIYHKYFPATERDGNRRLINAHKQYCGTDTTDDHAAQSDIIKTIKVLNGQFKQHPELPRNIYELNKLCLTKLPDYVDHNGKLIWRKNKENNWEVVCNYFKPEHRGKPLSEVIKIDPEYIQWALEPKDFDYSDEVKQILRDALIGIYPTSPIN